MCDTVHIRSYNVKSHWKVHFSSKTTQNLTLFYFIFIQKRYSIFKKKLMNYTSFQISLIHTINAILHTCPVLILMLLSVPPVKLKQAVSSNWMLATGPPPPLHGVGSTQLDAQVQPQLELAPPAVAVTIPILVMQNIHIWVLNDKDLLPVVMPLDLMRSCCHPRRSLEILALWEDHSFKRNTLNAAHFFR